MIRHITLSWAFCALFLSPLTAQTSPEHSASQDDLMNDYSTTAPHRGFSDTKDRKIPKDDLSTLSSKLDKASCGQFFGNYRTGKVSAELVPGATSYLFKFTQASNGTEFFVFSGKYGRVVFKNHYYFSYGNRYTVQVMPIFGDVLGQFGKSCKIALEHSVTLDRNTCGLSTSNGYVDIQSEIAPGAQRYHFEFTNDKDTLLMTTGKTGSFRLKELPGVERGTTYKVRVSPELNGQRADFGSVCRFTFEEIPELTTQMQEHLCGQVFYDKNETIAADEVRWAARYEFMAIGQSSLDTFARMRTSHEIKVKDFKTPFMGEDYDVSVRMEINGVWTEYGSVCTMTFGSGVERIGITDDETEVLVYPTLFSDYSSISNETDYELKYIVSCANGQIHEQGSVASDSIEDIGGDLARGSYVVHYFNFLGMKSSVRVEKR